MTYSTLVTILKGSSSSGNWGHAGRPGKIGGSASGGGHAAIGIPSDADRTLRAERIEARRVGRNSQRSVAVESDIPYHNRDYVESKFSKEGYNVDLDFVAKTFGMSRDDARTFVGRTFSYNDEPSGLSTIITEFYRTNAYEAKVSGEVYDKDGNQVGNFTRTINSNKSIYHDIFELNREVQGSGFGSRFYQHAEASYEKAGVKSILLQANLQVGGYAWARMGFDAADNVAKRKLTREFNETYRQRYGQYPDTTPSTAYAMAAAIGPDGHRIGKDALLGSDWLAVKNLSKDDSGYIIGQEYYKSKKAKL